MSNKEGSRWFPKQPKGTKILAATKPSSLKPEWHPIDDGLAEAEKIMKALDEIPMATGMADAYDNILIYVTAMP